MTAEGSTGAPLRQQIAESIHKGFCDCSSYPEYCREGWPVIEQFQDAADAVVALLNLTEERSASVAAPTTGPRQTRTRYVTPWLPSTPPDTSSEPA